MWLKCVSSVACVCFGSFWALAGETAVHDNWSGFSFGRGIGTNSADIDGNGPVQRAPEAEFKELAAQAQRRDFTSDDWDVLGTAQIGYDKLIGQKFVVGAFADYDFNSNPFIEGPGASLDRDGSFTLGGRLGYLVTPQMLIYGLGGYSQVNLSYHSTEADVPEKQKLMALDAAEKPAGIPDALYGWTVGGGLESKLPDFDDRLSVKLEYRYSQFDSVTGDENVKQAAQAEAQRLEEAPSKNVLLGESSVQSVRAVLVWKLNPN